jgi:hypothetical protein
MAVNVFLYFGVAVAAGAEGGDEMYVVAHYDELLKWQQVRAKFTGEDMGTSANVSRAAERDRDIRKVYFHE